MKKYLFVFLMLALMLPVSTKAEDFMGAPIIPGGTIIERSKKRLELKIRLPHDEVLAYYKEALKGLEDIKFRDWKKATYIEDDGKLAWHSIMVSKDDPHATTIVITKDSWTWIMGTLFLRFIGVFVVLLVLLLGMTISGNIISRSVKRSERKKG